MKALLEGTAGCHQAQTTARFSLQVESGWQHYTVLSHTFLICAVLCFLQNLLFLGVLCQDCSILFVEVLAIVLPHIWLL
jgi:hypothetical protein